MACPYLPDGCTQDGLDSFYGYDEPDPREDDDPWNDLSAEEFSLYMTDPGGDE